MLEQARFVAPGDRAGRLPALLAAAAVGLAPLLDGPAPSVLEAFVRAISVRQV